MRANKHRNSFGGTLQPGKPGSKGFDEAGDLTPSKY